MRTRTNLKKVAFIVIFVIITVFAAACSVKPEPPRHEHSFVSAWSCDEENHWRVADCEHTDEIFGKEKHSFNEGTVTEPTFEADGFVVYSCTVCSFAKTESGEPKKMHSFASSLSYDQKTHWYACLDEGYEGIRKDESLHILTETSFSEESGEAVYSCECGYEEKFLRTTVTATPSVDLPVYYGQKLTDLPLTGGKANVEGEFVWASPEQEVVEDGEYLVVFTPTSPDYAAVSSFVSLDAEWLTVTVLLGENGSATHSGVVTVKYGGSLTVTVTPDGGYSVGAVTVNGEPQTGINREVALENITEPQTIAVTFAEIEQGELPFSLTFVSGTPDAYYYENGTLYFSGLTEDSVYALTGEHEGSIVVEAEEHKLDLELTGFTQRSKNAAPITVNSGNEVSITAKSGTENYIYDEREAVDPDSEEKSAAIYSAVDLELCGKGSLFVESKNNNGVHCKDDLKVKNLTLYIKCKDNALKGNDGVVIESGKTTLIATVGDCVKTSNSHVSEQGNQKGAVEILGGEHALYAACDGIDSAYDVIVSGENTSLSVFTDRYSEHSDEVTEISGEYYVRYTSNAYRYSIKYYNSVDDFVWVNASNTYTAVSSGNRPGQKTTYYYYTVEKKSGYSRMAVYMYSSAQVQGQEQSYYAKSDYLAVNDGMDTLALTYRSGALTVSWTNYQLGTGGGFGGGMNEGNSDKGVYSTKGIKACNEIKLLGGKISVKAYDDALHAKTDETLENGALPTGNITVSGGEITLLSHDDGVHADGILLITGGTLSVTKSYEGLEGTRVIINGGTVSVTSADDGVNATQTTGAAIEIGGGRTFVFAGGDGLDSNSQTSYGAIAFKGGDTVVVSTSGGNSAIDSDGGYSYTGGRVLAVMPSGMDSESRKCSNFSQIGCYKTGLTLSSGSYFTVSSGSVLVSVKMPASVSRGVAIYLGVNGASFDSANSSSLSHDQNGVFWA